MQLWGFLRSPSVFACVVFGYLSKVLQIADRLGVATSPHSRQRIRTDDRLADCQLLPRTTNDNDLHGSASPNLHPLLLRVSGVGGVKTGQLERKSGVSDGRNLLCDRKAQSATSQSPHHQTHKRMNSNSSPESGSALSTGATVKPKTKCSTEAERLIRNNKSASRNSAAQLWCSTLATRC